MVIKPLETKKDQEKKSKRNRMWIGLFIVVLMVASTVGFALLQTTREETEESQQEYNNQKFVKTDRGWQTQTSVLGKIITINTFYLPQELENITTSGQAILDNFRSKTIYLVADDYEERQAASFLWSALNPIALRIQMACLEEESNDSFCQDNNLPTKNCDNANQQNTIIIIKEITEENIQTTTINFKNSCLLIEDKKKNLIKAGEKAIFMIFGIMD